MAEEESYAEEPQSDDPISVIVPYKNPKALIGYYLGVFSLIPCLGGLLGPAALILGILGLRARARNPRMHGKGHAIFAIIAGSLMTLVHLAVAIFALAARAARPY